MLVVSDTTPIISLIKIGHLEILHHLFGKVVIPDAVYRELTENSHFVEEAEIVQHCDYLICENVENEESVRILRKVTGLDAGESEAIVLYSEQKADFLIVDERKGRLVADKLGVTHVGTIGILLQAYDEKILTTDEIKKSLEIFREKKIRISEELYQYVMRKIEM